MDPISLPLAGAPDHAAGERARRASAGRRAADVGHERNLRRRQPKAHVGRRRHRRRHGAARPAPLAVAFMMRRAVAGFLKSHRARRTALAGAGDRRQVLPPVAVRAESLEPRWPYGGSHEGCSCAPGGRLRSIDAKNQ